jgi:hypothetical protein
MKNISIKLTKAVPNSGPFIIKDQNNIVLQSNISKQSLVLGLTLQVDDSVTAITLQSIGDCSFSKTHTITTAYTDVFNNTKTEKVLTGCVWRHLTNIQLYNSFYGKIAPYVIEYPFAYQFQDEILQNVKDYTKAYKYLSISEEVYNTNTRIETNDKFFNKAILYNGQQSSGLLELVSKPFNNLKEYMTYPKYNTNSKTITFTKSDNFYQYNTFWAVQKDSQIVLFNTPCTSLSYDKVINEFNMDYTPKSFKKAPLRAKDLKIRHILDNTDNINLVSHFILGPSQISYK